MICVAMFRMLRIHTQLKVDISTIYTLHIDGKRSHANRRKHFMIIQNV